MLRSCFVPFVDFEMGLYEVRGQSVWTIPEMKYGQPLTIEQPLYLLLAH